MSDDIIARFGRVQAALSRPFGYIQAALTQDGRIAYRTGRASSVLIWSVSLVFCSALAWGAISLDGWSFLSYIFLAVAGLVAVLLVIFGIPGIVSPLPYFEIDPALRRITLYGGFPRWRPREVIPIEDIRMFVAHVCQWQDKFDSSLYAVTMDGICHPLIDHLGSISPQLAAKTLGYISCKLAVQVTEREPWLGLFAIWDGPVYQPKKGKHVDVVSMLEVAQVLYDPKSGDVADWAN